MLSRAFLAPCQPSAAPRPPSGDGWVHEIKHDGFRLMACREAEHIRLLTRNGHDWADRYPAVVAAVRGLRARSCLVDGEIVVVRPDGLACFEMLRSRQHDAVALLYAFDLLDLDGEDLRREPFIVRKATLASLLAKAGTGLRLNEHIEGDGPTVFAPRLQAWPRRDRLEAKDSRYRSGQTRDWVKSKNPASEAVRREAVEDWGR